MTLAQACEHSLAQLRLLHRALERRRAAQGLLDLRIVHAAVAAAWTRENASLVRGLAGELQKAL